MVILGMLITLYVLSVLVLLSLLWPLDFSDLSNEEKVWVVLFVGSPILNTFLAYVMLEDKLNRDNRE